MPTYEYRCNACKREFEVVQRMADADLVTCEACGADKLEKLISWTTVRSDNWKAALYQDDPKTAMKGLHAVDLSAGAKRFKGNDEAATATAATAATATSAEPALAPAAADAPAAAAPEPDATDKSDTGTGTSS